MVLDHMINDAYRRVRAAQKEAEKAAEAMRLQAKADDEKQALIERLTKPFNNGLTQVQVYRFPHALCTDRGRAINQQETDFASTLTGLPKEMYDF